jgi:hypothetical protein
MKTNMYILSYVAKFFLEWEIIFWNKIVEKIKTNISCAVTFFF